MRIAVLPFNAAEGTAPAYGRQFAAFASEQLRAHAGAEINNVSFLTQIESEDGAQRMAFVNIPELLPLEQVQELFGQAEVDLVQDGFLAQEGDNFKLTVRYHVKGQETPKAEQEYSFDKAGLFTTLHKLVKSLADQAQIGLPEFLSGETMEFGTDNADAFLKFLEGYDALNYIQQANGQVALEFDPQGPINALLAASEMDPDFEGPYHVLIQYCRTCAQMRIGTFEAVDEALNKAIKQFPDEFPAYFGLGEIHQSVGSLNRASELYEKAVQLEPNDPALYARLGIVQMQLGMPVNAERNFKKAFEMEGEDKPSADLLAQVLQQTGRAHEVPALWKGLIDSAPQNGVAHAKYAIALIQAGNEDAGVKAFEAGLESLEDNTVVKRFYAPLLAQKGEHDRAMDFYEDVLDVAPADVQVLVEYAQTLETAGREFEVPNVLKQVLQANPDPNTRANVLAKLIELEQPKRAENVDAARQKLESGDFQGALRDLKPLRNWLADYWKMWFFLAVAANQAGEHAEAEQAAKRALELFPGCEPAYGELASAILAQGRGEEAFEFMRFAASNNPGSLPIHLSLAQIMKATGHAEEARNLAKQIREAVGPNPDLTPILDELER